MAATKSTEARRFIRHPAGIPIEVSAFSGETGERLAEPDPTPAVNASVGGLSFHYARPLERGTLIKVRIALVRPAFESRARVAWCRPSPPGYTLGAQFIDSEDAFRARMVEQVCYIEDYRRRVLDVEHRPLTSNEAAMEWIAKFAARFPEPGAEDVH